VHHVVFNPVAGRGRARAALDEVVRLLGSAGVEHVLHVTTGPGHATELAAATEPGSVVVAMGGDGTVHEVVAGLLAAEDGWRVTQRTLGVVPVGSGDDYAFAHGLASGDLPGAVGRLTSGSVRRADLAFVNGAPCVNAFGTGFDAEVAHRLTLAPRFLKGAAAYLYAVLISLHKIRPVGVTVELDGQTVYEGPSLIVAAQNGPRTGGSYLYSPEARVDDGLLDVVLAGDMGLASTLGLMPKVMKGRHLSDPQVHLHRGRHLVVTWDTPRYGHADGESAGRTTCFEVALEPAALPVCG
jgi:YegS/Rv2252/BmrU family lipid kinase